MYYQSRTNTLKDITDKTDYEILEYLKNMGISSAAQIDNFIFVNNANPSGSGISEIAVLVKKENKYYEFESLTIKLYSEEEFTVFLKEIKSEKSFNAIYQKMAFATSFNETDKLVYFNCSCCATEFKSTIKEQEQYDQDSGYGLCDNCSESW